MSGIELFFKKHGTHLFYADRLRDMVKMWLDVLTILKKLFDFQPDL